MPAHATHNRRDVLVGSTVALGLLLGPAGIGQALGQELAPTPACTDGDEPTLPQTEGPFYTPHAPQRIDLREPNHGGRAVALGGYVLTRRCRPVAGALVELWHADERGEYDTRGFRYRGHQFTDSGGRYRFLTIMPASYSGRTRHYHVRVQAPGQRVLTTQLYFPGEPLNRRDRLFRRELLLRVAESGAGLAAQFDFVLDLR